MLYAICYDNNCQYNTLYTHINHYPILTKHFELYGKQYTHFTPVRYIYIYFYYRYITIFFAYLTYV